MAVPYNPGTWKSFNPNDPKQLVVLINQISVDIEQLNIQLQQLSALVQAIATFVSYP
jgi:hypothetical protein